MALSTRRSPTWEGPRKWNISMVFSVGWARHSRLGAGRQDKSPRCFSHGFGPDSPPAPIHRPSPESHAPPSGPPHSHLAQDTSAQKNRTKVPFHSLEQSGLCALKQLSLRGQKKEQGLGQIPSPFSFNLYAQHLLLLLPNSPLPVTQSYLSLKAQLKSSPPGSLPRCELILRSYHTRR